MCPHSTAFLWILFHGTFLITYTDLDRRNMQSPLWLCAFSRRLIAKMAAKGEHVHVLYMKKQAMS